MHHGGKIIILFTHYRGITAVITKLDEYYFGSCRQLPITINFSGVSISAAKKAFKEAVDDYCDLKNKGDLPKHMYYT